MLGELYSTNTFYLAMSYWQLGRKDEAGAAYDLAASWTEKHRPTNDGLLRCNAEAAGLLGKESGEGSGDASVGMEPRKRGDK